MKGTSKKTVRREGSSIYGAKWKELIKRREGLDHIEKVPATAWGQESGHDRCPGSPDSVVMKIF